MTALLVQPQPLLMPLAGPPKGGFFEEPVASSAALPPSPPQTAVYSDVPAVTHASDQKFLKSEDVMYTRSVPVPQLGDAHSVFMVCDGHMGSTAADHCVQHLPGLLGQLLPPHLPDWRDERDVASYAEQVRRAISSAVLLLDNSWSQKADNSGTTLTLAVLSGWLVTVANTGDSNAIIDCGDDVKEVTHSHRIQVNKQEQARLRGAGAVLAPLGFHLQGPAKPQEMGVGPLRMWPGGLCVSRSIGDIDAGPLIIPLPHIRQVLVNRSRALRVILASDGLWDLMTFSKAAKSVRHKLPDDAVRSLMSMVVRDRRMADDVTVVICDVLPPPGPGASPPTFPASALKSGTSSGGGSSHGASHSGGASSGGSGGGGGGGLFALCFKSPAVSYEAPLAAAPPAASPAGVARCSVDAGGAVGSGPPARPWPGLAWMADVDCFVAYPTHGAQMEQARSSHLPAPGARPATPPQRGDFTVHGGTAHRFQQDSSWHTGGTVHGSSGGGRSVHGGAAGRSMHGGTSGLPTFLSDEQVQAVQAGGPAAAAGMVLGSGSNGRGVGQRPGGGSGSNGSAAHASLAAAVAAARDGSSGAHGGAGAPGTACDEAGEVGAGRRLRGGGQAGAAAAPGPAVPLTMSTSKSIVLPEVDVSSAPVPAGARPPVGASGGSSGSGAWARLTPSSSSAAALDGQPGSGGEQQQQPGASSALAMTRSASAIFEHDGSGAVYVAAGAGEGGAGGRLVAPPLPPGVPPLPPSHFGSAPHQALPSTADTSDELHLPSGLAPIGAGVYRAPQMGDGDGI